ncbi:MAG: 50S ribosomal protein L6 [Calditrichaeota bacterium]|nr:50S ribosomal protein L6 [Calditrichota bacterium]
MSRVGREPIPIPDGVKLDIKNNLVEASGKLGEMQHELPHGISAVVNDGKVEVSRSDESRQQRSLHGLSRTLVANMLTGVSQGFKRELEIVGVGYRCELKGKALQLTVGFSHKVIFVPPDGITFKVTSPTRFNVNGIDKQVVGDIAAKVRAVRPPEPYKGKGIKYIDEYIRRKAGKSTAS